MKIVVVVDGIKEAYKEIFEGKNLTADISPNKLNIAGISETNELNFLKIGDGDKQLAAFKEWTYWRYTQ